MKISSLNRFFNITFGALAMVAVALFSAYLAMRIAIHGREVEVPTLSGLTLPEAGKRASALGLRLNVENRFYSPVAPSGTVLSQSPAPRSVVRRDWTVRVTESLGAQQVSIPNLVGQAERPATIAIRRLNLELGTVAHIASPGLAGIVLAQTPNPSDTPASSPRISLLLSAPEPPPAHAPYRPAADLPDPNLSNPSLPNPNLSNPDGALPSASTTTPASANSANSILPAAAPDAPSIAMPSLIGLNLSAAVARASAVSLHIAAVEEQSAASSAKTANPTPTAKVVVAQSPAAGHRVQTGAPVKITLGLVSQTPPAKTTP